MRIPPLIAAGAGLCICFAACSEGGRPAAPRLPTLVPWTPSPAGALSACRLVAREEAEALVGPLRLLENMDPSVCIYAGEKSVVTVTVAHLDPADAAAAFDREMTALGGAPVEGVGDAAFWVPVARKLYVRWGAEQVAISVPHSLGLDEALQVLVELAEGAGRRLDGPAD